MATTKSRFLPHFPIFLVSAATALNTITKADSSLSSPLNSGTGALNRDAAPTTSLDASGNLVLSFSRAEASIPEASINPAPSPDQISVTIPASLSSSRRLFASLLTRNL